MIYCPLDKFSFWSILGQLPFVVSQHPKSFCLFFSLLDTPWFSYKFIFVDISFFSLFYLAFSIEPLLFFPNKYHFEIISWLGFQSISSDSKLFRLSVPHILMPVQVIWRFELPVHHEESSRSDWKLYHLPTFLLKLDEGFRAPPKNQAWARLWHSHYNHEGGVNAGQIEGGTCHQQRSWKM